MPFEGRPIEDCDSETGSWTCSEGDDDRCPTEGVVSSPQGTNRAWIAPNDATEFCVRDVRNVVKCSRIPYHVRPIIPTDDPLYRTLTAWEQVFIKSDGAAPFACAPECFAWNVQPVQRENIRDWVRVYKAGDTHIEPLPMERRVDAVTRAVMFIHFHDSYQLGYMNVDETPTEGGGGRISSEVYCHSALGGLVRVTEETLELEEATWYRTKEACERSGNAKSLGNLQRCVGDSCGR